MSVVKNVQKPDGTIADIHLETPGSQQEIDGTSLTLLPALIDPHVHFRAPGSEHKETWLTGSKAALQGGVTTVFDMPNNTPPCVTYQDFMAKQALIQSELEKAGIPLRFHLFFGADKNHLGEIPKVKNKAIGIKVFMGSSTGSLLMDDPKALDEVFKIAKEEDMLVAVHAEDESIISKNKIAYKDLLDPSVHSKIREEKAAFKAVEKALSLSSKHGTRLVILHVSTKEELKLIKQAKAAKLPVFAEATPHHLFFTDKDYAAFGNKIKVNPPIRSRENQNALWESLKDGTIDYLGTDHAPHTIEEKSLNYKDAPAGIPGIEFLLPLFLDAVLKKRITLNDFVNLTRRRIESIYRLQPQNDFILVNLNVNKEIKDEELKTKCGWSPYNHFNLFGHLAYAIIKGKIFKMESPCFANIR